MLPLDIHELTPAELPQAAAVLGRGMRDNPLHIKAFGEDPARREASLERFFLPVLKPILKKGFVLGAYRGEAMVGVCAMSEPGHCQPSALEKLRIVPGVLARDGSKAVGSINAWTKAWAKHDPETPHWHLGPVAVDRAAQGQGVGSALLTAFTRRMDERRVTAYLETDKPDNVGFCRKHGFEVVAEEPVLGVANWYMTRPPQLASQRRNGTPDVLAVRRVLETALYCDRLEQTSQFYRDVFGFKPHFEDARLVAFDAGGGTVLLLFRRGGSTAAVPLAGGTIPPHDGAGPSHVALAVPAGDLEAWEARLSAAGVTIDGRVSWERGGRSLYFRDPEGHSVELATPGIWATY